MTHINLQLRKVTKIMQPSLKTNTHPPIQESTCTLFTKPATKYWFEPEETNPHRRALLFEDLFSY